MGSQNTESALKSAPAPAPTLDDVARAAGVSPATVSRCLNRPDAVRPDKRRKIMEAVERLHYVPHGAARALASRRSRMIGAIYPALDTTLFGNAMEAFQDEMTMAGYTVAVASSGFDPDTERVHIRNLLESGVDALMLVGGARSRSVYDLIDAKRIPYVLTWIWSPDGEHPYVGFDNAAASRHLTDYLLMLGHQRFAVVTGPMRNNDRQQSRFDGINQALAERGLALEPELVFERTFHADEGRKAFRLMMSAPSPPTAIICGAEPLAYGAIFEANDMGVSVPDQVSIAGFDDTWLASQIRPSLTTVWTPRRDMAKEAARFLLAKLDGERVAPPRQLETKLIVRQSTGRPPAR